MGCCQAGDSALVLASDGLWDVMSDSEVVGILARVRTHRSKQPPAAAA